MRNRGRLEDYVATPEDLVAFARIAAALDRFEEAHFWIHALQRHYHSADVFRWHLNAFLKAIKEIPQLISMSLQNADGFAKWFKARRESLHRDPLLGHLAKQRDVVVHQGMLSLNSKGSIGITRGRKLKLGIGMPIDPREDSDAAMDRFVALAAQGHDFLHFLAPDEDTLPCVERTWKLPGFDDELVELCSKAWLRTGETIVEVLAWLGAGPLPLSLDCRHAFGAVQLKLYDRDDLRARMESIRAAD